MCYIIVSSQSTWLECLDKRLANFMTMKFVTRDNSQRHKLWTDQWEAGIIFLRKIWNVCQEKLQIFYQAIWPLPHMFSAKNLYWHCRKSFPSRHHLIFVLITRKLLAVFEKRVEECECDWPSVANGMVGWSLYVVWPFYTCLATLMAAIVFPLQDENVHNTIYQPGKIHTFPVHF